MDNHINYRALSIIEKGGGQFERILVDKNTKYLPPGDVLIKVAYSSLNYKDALSASGNRGVTKHYPHTPGIDAVGTVVEADTELFLPDEVVLCTGYDLGMNTPGGFGQYIRVPHQWVIRKPEGLSPLETMQIGTAGFTAAQSVLALQVGGISPSDGPILVTGATGGVGTVAIMLLTLLGYEITAVTGKAEEYAFLRSLGAISIIDRDDFIIRADKLLLKEQWAGVIDSVGGRFLAEAIKATKFDGVVTSCGNAASDDLPLNVYPFILRGIKLQGIYSANCPMKKRLQIWDKLSGAWKLPELSLLSRVITLSQLDDSITDMLAGRSKGRIVVDVQEE